MKGQKIPRCSTSYFEIVSDTKIINEENNVKIKRGENVENWDPLVQQINEN